MYGEGYEARTFLLSVMMLASFYQSSSVRSIVSTSSTSSTVDLGQLGDPMHSGAEAAVDAGADGAGVVDGVDGALTGERGRLNGPPIVTCPVLGNGPPTVTCPVLGRPATVVYPLPIPRGLTIGAERAGTPEGKALELAAVSCAGLELL